jgi:uncharacterized protein (TIGR00369 family)
MQQRFAWHAAGPQAFPAEPLVLDQRDFRAKRGASGRDHETGGAAANNANIEFAHGIVIVKALRVPADSGWPAFALQEAVMTTAEELNEKFKNRLPGLIGMRISGVALKRVTAELDVREDLLAPNGYLHGASVVALADTTCGCGTLAHLPEGAKGFTTIELKCNFVNTAREGRIVCEARLEHEGRRTHVWDAAVKDATTGKMIALFRCTQMILS